MELISFEAFSQLSSASNFDLSIFIRIFTENDYNILEIPAPSTCQIKNDNFIFSDYKKKVNAILFNCFKYSIFYDAENVNVWINIYSTENKFRYIIRC